MPKPRILDLDGAIVLLDEDIHGSLGDKTLYVGTNGYVYFSTHATGPVTLHSFVWGGTQRGFSIDHVNGNKLDNRRDNLRLVTYQLNQANRKNLNSNNTSGARGVIRRSGATKNPWLAQIMVNRKTIHLGVFATMVEAVMARKAAELKFFGELCP